MLDIKLQPKDGKVHVLYVQIRRAKKIRRYNNISW